MFKAMTALHHLNDTLFHKVGWHQILHAFAAIHDAALGDLAPFGFQQVRHRLERRRLARANAPQKGGDPAFRHLQADTFQHKDDVIVDHLDIVDLKKGLVTRSCIQHPVSPSRSGTWPCFHLSKNTQNSPAAADAAAGERSLA
jgi:hypothetical protein